MRQHVRYCSSGTRWLWAVSLPLLGCSPVDTNVETESLAQAVLPEAAQTVSLQRGSDDYDGVADTSITNRCGRSQDLGSAEKLLVAAHPTSRHDALALVSWDVSSVAPGNTVVSAALSFEVTKRSHLTHVVRAMRRDWSESEATWYAADEDLPWQVPGARGIEDRAWKVLARFEPSTTGRVTIPLNAAGVAQVQQWIDDPESNAGFIISRAMWPRRMRRPASELRLASSEDPDITLRPELSITYLPPPDPDILITRGAQWRYLDDGSDQGTEWTTLGYDDADWLAGPAEFGYGDGDEATVVSYGPSSRNKYVTTYFRHTFDLNYPESFDALKLDLIRDDGAVVYLNGTEVHRTNLPEGEILFDTMAESQIAGANESTPETVIVDDPPLVFGTNVVAVEMHQGSASSSDLSFDFMLRRDNTLIPRGAVWSYLDDGSDQGMAFAAPDFDDSGWSQGPAELGYGDGDEATVVEYGPDARNRYTTTYFRHAFEVDDPAKIPSLQIGIVRDDGAIVYLNGTEVFRTNMPSGEVSFDTLASSQIAGSNESAMEVMTIRSDLLVAGSNVIAVELHQGAPNSSDISFDLELLVGDPLPPPLPDLQGDEILLLAAGDIGECGSTGQAETAALLDQLEGPIALVGDAAQNDGSMANFLECFDPEWGRHLDRIHPVPGNHEYMSSDDAAPYFEYFGAAAGPDGLGYYSYDVGDWHIVALNSNCDFVGCDEDSAQVQWLEADLSAHPSDCTLAYFHHPRYSSGLHGNNSSMNDVWQVLMDHGTDVVLSGHDHGYERWLPMGAANDSDPNGIVQFVVGTGGATLRSFAGSQPSNSVFRDNAHWGMLRLRLRATEYDFEFLPADGGLALDWGTTSCH